MRKLATAAIAYTAAVFAAHYLLPHEYFLLAAIISGASSLVAIILRGDARRRMLLISLAAALGFSLSYVAFLTKTVPAQAVSGEKLTISATVAEYPRVSDKLSTVEIRLSGENVPELGALLYATDVKLPALVPGDEIRAEVQLKSTDMRYGKKSDSFAANDNYLICYLKGEVEIVGKSKLAFLNFPKTLSKNVVETAQKIFPRETFAFVSALITGDKTALYEEVDLYSDMSAAGILHVVAVSGMHVAFLVGFIRTVVRKKRWASFIGIPIIWFFVPMAGASPSVIRAAFMQSAVLLAPLFHRENDGITSLSAVLAALLIINPDACASVSLQLSFAAMVGIILVSPRVNGFLEPILRERRKRHKDSGFFLKFGDKLLTGITATFAGTIGAMVFSTPVAVLWFGYASVISIIVNILVFWAISACFILSYISCFLGMLWLPLGKIIGFITGFFAQYIIQISHLAGDVPNAVIYTQDSVFGLWLILVYIIFGVCMIFKRKSGFRPIIPTCLAVCSLCAAIIFTDLGLNKAVGSLTAADVGQGQSIVLASGRQTVVIDCGGKGKVRNAGDTITALLLSEGRKSIDVLALTHFDEDHVNGAVRLMSRIDVKALVVPPDAGDAAIRDEIIEFAAEQGVKVYIISEDTRISAGEIELCVYAPVSRRDPTLMYLASVGDFDAFISGDADSEMERRLLMTHDTLPDTEVFVAGHHGSKYSSSAELLTALNAEYALVSNGYNTYGHPAAEVLERFEAAGMKILRTEKMGDVTILLEE
ncbi:MAG: ComEC/Rec2 family competence protein [Oscillospiraceae bacterium]